jgi:precorrin-3B synthase
VRTIARKGWCPGVLRPMESGDGYLVRLRFVNGVVSFALANEIAALSEQFGNGLIDLSARANLQMRGVTAGHLESLWARLAEIGLLDADPNAEAVRNVISSPLAGFDDSAVLDTRPVVVALEGRLTHEQALRALPAKFGFVVDGGGVLALTGIDADVGFRALRTSDGPRFSVHLNGAPAGAILPADVPDCASAIIHAFLALRADERRMGALIKRIGAAAIAQRVGLNGHVAISGSPPPVEKRDFLGVRALGARSFVGAAIAFGQLRAQNLRQLGERAKARGAAELRLTPWRAVLAPGLEAGRARALADELANTGFILDGDDPLLVLAACSGKPACASACADVRSTALSLVPSLARYRGTLHVSGCRKGCAHNARAPLTLVASPGGYDLVKDGFARDEPSVRGLTIQMLATYLGPQGKGNAV